jgi:serine/threonine protein kinase
LIKHGILRKGERVADTYDVDCYIGEGAFGEVYRVKHKFLGLQVLKVFKTDYVAGADIDTVISEARILTKLTDANVVRVFDAGSCRHNGQEIHYMTTEFVSGETLAQRLKREIDLSLEDTLLYSMDLLTGLSVAHSHSPPIVHRDISPDNVLLSYGDGRSMAKLSDFGLAMSCDVCSGIAGGAGKYQYFAPECFWNVYLPTSDVFSAGIVIYRMLTGIHPWYCEADAAIDDPEQIATAIKVARRAEVVNPSHYKSEIPTALDGVIQKALATELEDRYRDAMAFLKDIVAVNEDKVVKQEGIDT